MGPPHFPLALLYWIPHSVPTLPLLGPPPLREHSSIPIGAPPPRLALHYFIPHSRPPPPFSALLCQFGRSSIPIGAPQHRFGTLLFHSALLQHRTSQVALLFSLVAGPLFHSNISYCLSNPNLYSPLANISLHVC